MDVLRTPDSRFTDLPGYSFTPHYTEVASGDGGAALRIHHVDVGPESAAPVLLMHGEPSWSYLYRTMIPVLVHAGSRCIAPDLVGFGRSDKPAARDDYTYQRHVDWMSAWLEANDLRRITLVGQDWGGLIGLRLATAFPERFDRIVTANTFLPTGDRDPGPAFLAWRKFSQEVDDFHVGSIVNGGTSTDLAAEVVAAYDAPFPDDSYKAGARQFPTLVPARPDDPASEPNRKAWEVLHAWTKPFLTAFSDSDPVTAGSDRFFQRSVPGAAGQPHTTIVGGGHFLQEDHGEELAAVVAAFVATTPTEARP
jgi:haloalkane dehalogenase